MIDFPPVSEREQFCAVLSNGSIRQGDAIVLLTGDGDARVSVAAELFKCGAAPVIVVTGGYTNPPHSVPATEMAGSLIGMGIAPDCVVVDNDSMHTQDQARHVLEIATERKWRRLLLVASPYHQFRAFLTFLKVLKDAGQDGDIHLVSVPAGMHIPWFGVPAGRERSRVQLLAEEFGKVEQYAADVASYGEGLEYLRQWESR